MFLGKHNSSSRAKTRLKKNDTVLIKAGREKGKTGRILRIDYKKGRAFIQGRSMIKKAMRPTQQNEKGGIIDKESSIHLSNLMLVADKMSTGGRMGSIMKENKKIRVIRKNKKEVAV